VQLFLFDKDNENIFAWYVLAFISLVLVISLNSANFLIYLGGYSVQTAGYEPLLIGMIIAAGICISVAILLYLALLYCDNKGYHVNARLFLLLFGAGQLIKASHLLEQIDVFPSGSPLWDSNYLVAESSEFGQFFMALFGYDATPSLMQVTLYISALITPVFMLFISEKMFKHIKRTQKNNKKYTFYQQGQK
jgi:high-affinity iron transporter